MSERQRLQRLIEDANGHLTHLNREQGNARKVFEDLYLHTRDQIRVADRHHHNATVATHKFREAMGAIAELMPSLLS